MLKVSREWPRMLETSYNKDSSTVGYESSLQEGHICVKSEAVPSFAFDISMVLEKTSRKVVQTNRSQAIKINGRWVQDLSSKLEVRPSLEGLRLKKLSKGE
jgi:hypothetical protein